MSAGRLNLISLANTAENRDLVGNNIAVTQFWLNAHGNLPYWPMREADVIFNPAVPIATDGRPKAFDLQAVLTHELGDALGLDHSSIPAATMWPYGDQGETRDRTPDADDVAAVQATYGTLSDATHGTISGRVLAAGDVPVFGAPWSRPTSRAWRAAALSPSATGATRPPGCRLPCYSVMPRRSTLS